MGRLAAPPGFRGAFRTDDDARAVYAEAAGIGRTMPRAVARPDDVASVSTLVRWAAAHRIPIVPRGSGSSMAGGAIGDGVILDLGVLNTIGAVDRTARRVTVGAGAVRDAVDAAARVHGLRFAVDPSSGRFCTVGGMIATNAAGAHSLAFGAMRDAVLALDCVFADGSRATLRRGAVSPDVPALGRMAAARERLAVLGTGAPFGRRGILKESSGYALDAYVASGDPIDLVAGAEGTLAIVVAAELALRALPGTTRTLLAAFASLDDAVHAAMDARAAGAVACELLDRTFLDVARAGGHAAAIPPDAEAVLLAEVEGDVATIAASAARLEHTFAARGAASVLAPVGPVAQAELWELRHAASPTIARLHPALRSMQFVEDGAVPPVHFAAYVRGVRAILARHGVRGVIFGHAADAHAHVNPLLDLSESDWHARLLAVLDDTTALVASLGGTLAAEHGDGRLRTPLMARVWPDAAREAFAMVKAAFDPDGLLNPGVKVPTPGQAAIERVKYDPTLPPLPPRAAAVLDDVTARRGYADSRLALLDAMPR